MSEVLNKTEIADASTDAAINTEGAFSGTPTEDAQGTGEPVDGNHTAQGLDTLPIQYNHEQVNVSKEEAIRLAQLGKLWEENETDFKTYRENKDVLSQLVALAASAGKTPAELISAVQQADEERIYAETLSACGGDEELAKRMYEAEKTVRAAAAKTRTAEAERAAEKARKDTADRIATEFSELQKEWPEIADIRSLPQTVVETAAKDGVPLIDSYLRYLHKENKKKETNAAAQAAAGAATTGGATSAKDEDNSLFSAFLTGLKG